MTLAHKQPAPYRPNKEDFGFRNTTHDHLPLPNIVPPYGGNRKQTNAE